MLSTTCGKTHSGGAAISIVCSFRCRGRSLRGRNRVGPRRRVALDGSDARQGRRERGYRTEIPARLRTQHRAVQRGQVTQALILLRPFTSLRPARGASPQPRPCLPGGCGGASPRTHRRAEGPAATWAPPWAGAAEAAREEAVREEARGPSAARRREAALRPVPGLPPAGPRRASREAPAGGPRAPARSEGATGGPRRRRPPRQEAPRLRMRHFGSQWRLFHDEVARGKRAGSLYSDDFLPRPAPPLPERRSRARPLQTVGRRNREL